MHKQQNHQQELLFRREIEALAQQHPRIIDAHFICTQEKKEKEKEAAVSWTGRTARIDAALLWSLIPLGEPPQTLIYVCGPSAMIDDVERWACVDGDPRGGRPPLRRELVLFERWW
jgi:ferredoxin-NADP reductase